MEIKGNLNFGGNKMQNVAIAIDSNFPADPEPGRMVFKDRVLYICTAIEDDLPVWVPMTKQLNMAVHKQAEPALEWTFNHGLNINAVFAQVYDEDGKWVIPDVINTSVMNQVTVGFSMPIKGTLIVQRGETEGSAQPITAYEQSFTNLDTWVIPHMLGHNPIIRVIIGTNEVQPLSIVHDSTMQATVTFSKPQTGSVRCI
jgi:hypothetical protein